MHEDMVCRAFFCASTVIIVGNDRKINFWQDPWLDGCSMAELVPDLYQVVSCRRHKNHLVSDALVDGTWVQDVTGPPTVPVMMQFVFIHQTLQHVSLTAKQEDRWVWRWDSSGVFSVASTYQALFIGQYPILGAKEVWQTKAPAKCRFFVWQTLLGMHWTSEWLRRHGLRDDAACALYDQEPETIDHLLIHCSYSREVWFKVLSRCGWQRQTTNHGAGVVEWWLTARKRVSRSRRTAFDSRFRLVSWSIRLQRNARVHRGTTDSRTRVIDSVWSLVELWSRAELVARSELLGM
jgi:hypothetical protein